MVGASEHMPSIAALGEPGAIVLLRGGSLCPLPCTGLTHAPGLSLVYDRVEDDVVRLTYVLAGSGETISLPSGNWLVKILAREGRFVFGVYRRHMKATQLSWPDRPALWRTGHNSQVEHHHRTGLGAGERSGATGREGNHLS